MSEKHKKDWVRIGADLCVIGAFFVSIYFSHDTAKTANKALDAANEGVKIAQTTLDNSSKSFRIDKRPYIVGAVIVSTKKPTLGEVYEVDVNLKNSGETPAINVLNYMDLKVLDAPPDDMDAWKQNLETHISIASRGTLSAGGSIIIPIKTKIPVSQEMLDDINGGLKKVYVYGVVIYGDVFGDKHETYISGFYDPGSPDNAFVTSPIGNEMK